MHGIFSKYYVDLVVAMLLFGLLGFMFVADEYHAAIGLLVVSMIIFMMLVDVLLLGVLFSEMIFTCGS